MKYFFRRLFFITAILTLFLVVSLYKLDEIPGEWFGDISNVHEYVAEILAGKLPFYFFQSAGPLYMYLISPFISVFGTGFIVFKEFSSLVGMLGLLTLYLLVKEIADGRIALITILITGVSFWYVVYGRLGNLQIIVPTVVSGMLYYTVRLYKYKKTTDLLFGVFVSGLGLFIYPAAFLLPLIYMFFIVFSRTGKKFIILGIFAFIPILLIFAAMIYKQRLEFTQGYVGSKLFNASKINVSEKILITGRNMLRTALMLHSKGDVSFRVNVPSDPQLDMVSRLLFIAGLIYWSKKERRAWVPYFIIATLMLIGLSITPTIPVAEIPNSSRVIGIIPIVYLLVGSGLWYIYTFFLKIDKAIATAFCVCIVLVVTYLNVTKYFIIYPRGLPNDNTPYGQIIANSINQLPRNAKVYIIGCCWGEAGQPEPKGILANSPKRDIQFFAAHDNQKEFSCSDIIKDSQSKPIYFVVNPYFIAVQKQVRSCRNGGEEKFITVNNFTVAWSYTLGL